MCTVKAILKWLKKTWNWIEWPSQRRRHQSDQDSEERPEFAFSLLKISIQFERT